MIGQTLRSLRTLSLLAALLTCVTLRLPAASYGSDAVEELRQALRTKIRDSNNADELQFRKALLEKRIKALPLSDYRKALTLDGWRDQDPDDAVAAVDRGVRQELIDSLSDKLRALLKDGSPPAKLAAITLIAEVGMTVRSGAAPKDLKLSDEERARWARGGLARQFGPDLIALLRDRNSTVSEFAARALGRINPDPEAATKALGQLLTNGMVAERRAAAEGLLNMLQSLLQVTRTKSSSTADVYPEDLARADRFVVRAAGLGVPDTDVTVRKTCLEAIRLGASMLHEPPLLIELPESQRADFPPPGRKLTPAEQEDIKRYRNDVEAERRQVLPVMEVLAEQVPTVLHAVGDPVPQVRLLACRALEEMGDARSRLARKAAGVPRLDEPRKEGAQEQGGRGRQQPAANAVASLAAALADDKDLLAADPLSKPLQNALETLALRAVSDSWPRIRLAAVDAIEPLSRDAAPVLPILARALQDGNNFVRWASARVVGKIGPVNTALTVPLLVRLLTDEDLDVELAAVAALTLYGPAAIDALPALTAAVGAGDVERRLAAIHALQAIGRDAQPAIPMMTDALANKDPRVRRAAAEALGQFGPAASSAAPALERVLTDVDPEVRKVAADALLAVTAGK
jgi:HEAT repeat protein